MSRKANGDVDKLNFLIRHQEGLSAAQLADIFHISTRHVARLRRELGVAQPSPHSARRMDAEWKAKAGALLDEGAPIKEVARTLGCDEDTVHRHFPGRGWDRTTVARHGKAIRDANEEFEALHIMPIYTNRR
jgi:transcriptional regulator with XRE-family HTH domain